MLLTLIVTLWLALPDTARAANAAPDLRPSAQVLLDPGGQLGPAEVLASPAWQSAPRDIEPLRRGQALWLRLTLPPAQGDAHRWLVIDQPGLDRAELFSPDGRGGWVQQAAGDQFPVDSWPIPALAPALRVMLSPDDPSTHLLRMGHAYGFSAPVLLMSEADLARHDLGASALVGGMLGLCTLGMVLALIQAWRLRDAVFVWYAAYVFTMALTQAQVAGLGGLFLWPGRAHWNDIANLVLPVWTGAMTLVFLTEALSLRARSREWALTLLITAAVVTVLTLPFASGNEVFMGARFALMPAMMLLPMVLGIAACIWAWRFEDQVARWLLVGYVPIVLAALLPMARAQELVGQGFWTQYGTLAALLVELPLLLFALHLRADQRRAMQRRAADLNRVDPTTGLLFESLFLRRIDHALKGLQRGNPAPVLLVADLVNGRELRSQYDGTVADEMLMRAAARVVGCVREFDVGGRLGPWRIGVLLYQPLSLDDLPALCQHIVASGLKAFPGLPGHVNARWQVAWSTLPHDAADAAALLTRMDEALANRSRRDHRVIVPLDLTEHFDLAGGGFPAHDEPLDQLFSTHGRRESELPPIPPAPRPVPSQGQGASRDDSRWHTPPSPSTAG